MSMNLKSLTKAQLVEMVEALRGELGEARRGIEAPTIETLPYILLDWCYSLTRAQYLPDDSLGREFLNKAILKAIPNSLHFSPLASAPERYAEAQGKLRELNSGLGAHPEGPEPARIRLAKQLDWTQQMESQAQAFEALTDSFRREYKATVGEDWVPPKKKDGGKNVSVPDNLDAAVAAQLAKTQG
jgi:hypothetical protein